MNYWLLKTEPDTYSWEDFEQEKKTVWDGVRNFQARNNLKAMKKGDLAFFYHSRAGREIIGFAKITQEYFPDPTAEEWVAVEITLSQKLHNTVTLAQIKANKKLASMILVRSSRLSVQPVREREFNLILAMSKN